jgi:hypothetical protein
MSRKGWSEKRTDIFGDEYIQHFDEDGNKAGWSQKKEGFSGVYFQHYDNEDNEVGWSEEAESLLGDAYTQHYDDDDEKAGWSEQREHLTGERYTQHFDNDNSKAGWSETKSGILTPRYTEHHKQSSHEPSVARERVASTHSGGETQRSTVSASPRPLGVGSALLIGYMVVAVTVMRFFLQHPEVGSVVRSRVTAAVTFGLMWPMFVVLDLFARSLGQLPGDDIAPLVNASEGAIPTALVVAAVVVAIQAARNMLRA